VLIRFRRSRSDDRRATHADGKSGGAGLGLSIARRAAEANGGQLDVEAVVSRGSVFRIVLPAGNRS
jgi:signal transduction histidine kinase